MLQLTKMTSMTSMTSLDAIVSLYMRWFPFAFAERGADLWTTADAYTCFSKHNQVLTKRDFDFKASYTIAQSTSKSDFADCVKTRHVSTRCVDKADETDDHIPSEHELMKLAQFAEFIKDEDNTTSEIFLVYSYRRLRVHRTWFTKPYGSYPPQKVNVNEWTPLGISGKSVRLERKHMLESLPFTSDIRAIIEDYYFDDGFEEPTLMWIWKRTLPTNVLTTLDMMQSSHDFIISSFKEVLKTSIKCETCTRDGDFKQLEILTITYECKAATACLLHYRTVPIIPSLTSICFKDASNDQTTRLQNEQFSELSRGVVKSDKFLFTMLHLKIPTRLFLCCEEIHFL